MKEKVLILNGARWTDKKSGEYKALLNIVFTNEESIANNPNFFGGQPITIDVDVEKFDIIRDLRMQVVEAEIDFVNNARNPLKPKSQIKTLKTKDGKIFNMA